MAGILTIIILGLVQGASEFLPISSSGHLVLLYNIFGIKDNTILLSVLLHGATLLAVLVHYRKDIFQLITHPFCKTNIRLVVATVPTVILALALKNAVEITFGNNFIIVGFLITAVILFLSQNIESRYQLQESAYFLSKNININSNNRDIANININFAQAIVVGLAQGLAVFPGVSRSGSTIATSMLVGVKKQDSADFSFLLSIPVIIGSLILEIIDYVKAGSVMSVGAVSLIAGSIVAFASGLLCISIMLKLVKGKKLTGFCFYLVLLSLTLVLNNYFHFLY